ncbi:uncharacterized protein LOC125948653 [Anopheles darlingi]|uniref:uncharacterized protein LOC125948653 n=1 Tax=Anopheles darlingi TaxID=43151 RepID=UPI0021006546|nr:uncharacterized protein LOC125948653 [Anopheles darlingi]
MTGAGVSMYYVGNIPKKATDMEVASLLTDYAKMTSFEFRLATDSYCPTKIAYVGLNKTLSEEQVRELNNKKVHDKRLYFVSTQAEAYFTPERSVVLRYLNEQITEEEISSFFRDFASVLLVQKPSHSYAYVEFKNRENVNYALTMTRTMRNMEMYIVPVKRNISVFLEQLRPVPYACLREKCAKLEIAYNGAAENETTLLIANIPRDTEENELLEFLSKFGKILDWQMQKSANCVLTNVGFVTYQLAKSARTVYLSSPLNFQGCGLDVYNHKLQYQADESKTAFILKRTSVYLTTDEIFQAFSACGKVEYIQRLDTRNYNTIVCMDSEEATVKAFKVHEIAGEPIHVRSYNAKQYNLPMPAPTDAEGEKSAKRKRKEAMLVQIIKTEDRRNAYLLDTQPNPNYSNPNEIFYRFEVQVWNYPPNSGLAKFREHFRQYGVVINLREVKQTADQWISVAYLSFDSKLEAKRVCQLNQSFMGSNRLLVLLADEMIVHLPELCVRVGNLTDEITSEDIYDRFSMVDRVKYVFRPMLEEAIVCFIDARRHEKALKVMCIGRFCVTVRPLHTIANDLAVPRNPVPGTHGALALPAYGETVPIMGGGMGPMPAVVNPMLLSGPGTPLPVPAPLPMAPRMPLQMANIGLPMQMGGGPVMVTPLMRGLMQQVEAALLKSNNFKLIPMMEQYNVVHGIICQCLQFPPFLKLNRDDKIRYLISGQNDFQHVGIFTLLTYPEQLEMLRVIEEYYAKVTNCWPLTSVSTPDPASSTLKEVALTAEPDPVPVPAPAPTADTIPNSTADPEPAPLNPTNSPLATTNHSWVADEQNSKQEAKESGPIEVADSDDDIPPAPSPPPISSLSHCKMSKHGIFSGMEGYDELDIPFMRKKMSETERLAIRRSMITVDNIPPDMTRGDIKVLFSNAGKVRYLQVSQPDNPKESRSAIIKFQNLNQATRALEVNLTELRGLLLKVRRYKEPYTPGFPISVTCSDMRLFSEYFIYETFKTCGAVQNVWTTTIDGVKTCIVDFRDKESVPIALKITYLHSGGRCRASVYRVGKS